MVSTNSLRFRFLAGESTNPREVFQDVKQTTSNQEHDGLACNGKLTAVPWTMSSSVAVFSTYAFQRFDANIPLIKGHNGSITDLSFSPFHESLLATASEDGLVKLWVIPDGGLTEHVKEEDMELKGHSKKVLALRWHHIAENLMATYSFDNNVKIWDVSAGIASTSFAKLSNVPTAMQWSPNGKMLGMMLKGSQMTFIDPRVEESVLSGASHNGAKSQKIQFIDDELVITSGFSRMNEREWAVWDLRQLAEGPVASGQLGDGSGIGHIYFDREHKLLFNAGRGDGSVQMFQYGTEIPGTVAMLGKVVHNQAQKGFSMMPKWCADVDKHEIGRSVRYLANNTLDYIGFRLSNKTGCFQEDLFPPFAGNEPASDAAAWIAGKDEPCKTMMLRPGEVAHVPCKKANFMAKLGKAPKQTAVAKVDPVAELKEQVAALTAKLAVSEQALSAQQVAVVGENNHENTSSTPTFGYWGIRGLGAQCRALLHYCGVTFTQRDYVQHYDNDNQCWDKSDWLNEKFNLGMEFPNLPYIIDDDVKITETLAIMKYVAKKWKPELLGRNAAEVGRVNMLEYHVFMLKMKSTMACYNPEAVLEDIITECRPMLAKIVEVTGQHAYLAGDNITYLDFMFVELLDLLNFLSQGSFYTEFPSLQAYFNRMVAVQNPEFWAHNQTLAFNGPAAKFNNIQ